MTHNSHAAAEAGYHVWSRNHRNAVLRQLADGVRALNFDVYEDDDGMWVCHGPCDLGSQPFEEILGEVRSFLEGNPREVLVLELQNEAPSASTAAAFESAGMVPFLREQVAAEPWPSLAELIEAGTRLVLFADAWEEGPAWYHTAGEHLYGNHWGARTVDELDCSLTTEASEFGLFRLNHFLTDPIALETLAEQVNHNPFFLERVEACAEELGKAPNLVQVDYYSIGDLFDVVRSLNGLGPGTSR